MKPSESTPNLFICYKTEIEEFVAKVCHCMTRQATIDYYFHPEKKKAGEITKQLENAIGKCDRLVLFLSLDTASSKWQEEEVKKWLNSHSGNIERIAVVNLHEVNIQLEIEGLKGKELQRVMQPDYDSDPQAAIRCADQILHLFGIPRASFDDLPTAIDAKYEKDIIKLYERNTNGLPADYIRKGYPPEWPTVYDYRNERNQSLIDNPLNPDRYGKYRSDDSAISVDVRLHERNADKSLTFPEAGPRKRILGFPGTLRIAILVSGGIAPGINSVISAILDRHGIYENAYKESTKYHNVETYGCVEGFRGLCEGGRMILIRSEEVREWANRGGSIIPTARADQLLEEDPVKREGMFYSMVDKLARNHPIIDILYVIGGEGSMRAAHALWTIHKVKYPNRRLSVIGIPKTMDNDILWVWQSFGFLSAVGEATRDIVQLSTEASSNPRIGIMQLFGSSSGYVVSHAALGSNVCHLALIPEMKFNMIDVCRYMRRRLLEIGTMNRRSPYGLIVMAETAIPIDFQDYMEESYVGLTDKEKTALLDFENNNRHLRGQTPDYLRSAGLKIVSRVLQKYIQDVMGRGDNKALGSKVSLEQKIIPDSYWEKFRVFTNEPRHLIRSMQPTVSDVAYGIRLGTMAVDMALAGYTDCMVSQWLTEYVVVPLKLVVLGRKQVPKEGIFWRTVISNTGQIDFETLS